MLITSRISFKVPTPPGKAIKTSDLSIINSFLREIFVIIISEKYFELGIHHIGFCKNTYICDFFFDRFFASSSINPVSVPQKLNYGFLNKPF